MTSELAAFAANSYTIKRGTEDHDLFHQYVTEVFEALSDRRTTILVTEGTEVIKAMGVAEPTLSEPHGSLTQAVLMASEYKTRTELAKELIDDPGVDLAGYLAMCGGRAIGNHLHAESLDGDGNLFVRFARNYDIVITKYQPEYEAPDICAKLQGFEIKIVADVARDSLVVSPA